MILVVGLIAYFLLVYRRLARLSVGFQDQQSFLSSLAPALTKLGFVSNNAAGEQFIFRPKTFMQGSDITVTMINPQSAAIVGPRPSVKALHKLFPGAGLEPNVGNQPWGKVIPPLCAWVAVYLTVVGGIEWLAGFVTSRG